MTMASMMAPAPGTPAVPMEARVASSTIMPISPKDRPRPCVDMTRKKAQTP